MKNWLSKSMFAAIALVAVAPLAAQRYPTSNDSWVTPGGGQTVIDLSGYPVSKVLGSGPATNVVSLKGQPLDTANLGSIDTLLERGTITLSGGAGSGNIRIVALSLTSEANVRLQDGRSYRLDVTLASTPSSLGSFNITQVNSDGGTFSNSFEVLPKLTFTNVASPFDRVSIDCAGGGCSPVTMRSSNSGWVTPGGAGHFDPVAKGVTPIRAGIVVQGYTTIGRPTTGAIYPGFSATTSFPPTTIDEQWLLNHHHVNLALNPIQK